MEQITWSLGTISEVEYLAIKYMVTLKSSFSLFEYIYFRLNNSLKASSSILYGCWQVPSCKRDPSKFGEPSESMNTSGPINSTYYLIKPTSAILKSLTMILRLRSLREGCFHLYMIRIACGLARPHSSERRVVIMIFYTGVKHTEWPIRVETLQTATNGAVNAKGLRTRRVANQRAILHLNENLPSQL